jgi:hypothetical protein
MVAQVNGNSDELVCLVHGIKTATTHLVISGFMLLVVTGTVTYQSPMLFKDQRITQFIHFGAKNDY